MVGRSGVASHASRTVWRRERWEEAEEGEEREGGEWYWRHCRSWKNRREEEEEEGEYEEKRSEQRASICAGVVAALRSVALRLGNVCAMASSGRPTAMSSAASILCRSILCRSGACRSLEEGAEENDV